MLVIDDFNLDLFFLSLIFVGLIFSICYLLIDCLSKKHLASILLVILSLAIQMCIINFTQINWLTEIILIILVFFNFLYVWNNITGDTSPTNWAIILAIFQASVLHKLSGDQKLYAWFMFNLFYVGYMVVLPAMIIHKINKNNS
jgi:hypothetical protein